MAYSDFTFDSALEAFALGFNEQTNLFPRVTERAPSQALQTLFEDHLPLAISTGKARSEFIYGAVTAGDNWRFLKLENKTVFVDLAQYHISQTARLIGILLQILQQPELPQALAA